LNINHTKNWARSPFVQVSPQPKFLHSYKEEDSINTILPCQHLEISEFGTYSVDVGGRAQVMTLQKCAQCGKYLALDGSEISDSRIISRGSSTKAKMRTITMQLSNDVYERLEAFMASEIGKQNDPSKVMSEVVALGLKDLERTVKHRQ
jgi:hypothetical protein